MNILQSLSLIPICLGVALPLNSNDQANTQSNLPIYQTNIQYQYETNDIDLTSSQSFNDSFINGNIYLFYAKCQYESGDSSELLILEDTGINTTISIVDIKCNSYSITFEDGLIVHSLNNLDVDLISINQIYYEDVNVLYCDNDDDVPFYITSDFNYFEISFTLIYNQAFSYDLFPSLSNDFVVSRCPTEYIPYILVEPQVSDNLYVNLYNFYYDLFKNDGINSITFEIGSQNITLSSWIAHSLTIISLILFVVIIILFVIWLFKFLSGFILLRQS